MAYRHRYRYQHCTGTVLFALAYVKALEWPTGTSTVLFAELHSSITVPVDALQKTTVIKREQLPSTGTPDTNLISRLPYE